MNKMSYAISKTKIFYMCTTIFQRSIGKKNVTFSVESKRVRGSMFGQQITRDFRKSAGNKNLWEQARHCHQAKTMTTSLNMTKEAPQKRATPPFEESHLTILKNRSSTQERGREMGRAAWINTQKQDKFSVYAMSHSAKSYRHRSDT